MGASINMLTKQNVTVQFSHHFFKKLTPDKKAELLKNKALFLFMSQANIKLISLIISCTHSRNLYDVYFVHGTKYFHVVVGLERT